MFFSDIHGNRYVIPSLISAISLHKPEMIIFCGDIYGYYYYQDEVIKFFKEFKVQSILGNHDKYFLDLLENGEELNHLTEKFGKSYEMNLLNINIENVQFIRTLKSFMELELDNKRIGVFHGSIDNHLSGRVFIDTTIINEQIYNNYDYVILGHTHHKMLRKINKTTILNPGSAGQQRDGTNCSFLILDTFNNDYVFYDLNCENDSLIRDVKRYEPDNAKLLEILNRCSVKHN